MQKRELIRAGPSPIIALQKNPCCLLCRPILAGYSHKYSRNTKEVSRSEALAMPVQISCQSCSASLKVRDEFLGRKGKCPKCGQIIALSPPTAAEPAPAEDDDEVRVVRKGRKIPRRDRSDAGAERPADREEDAIRVVRRGPVVAKEEEPDDEEEPRPRRKRKRRKRRPAPSLSDERRDLSWLWMVAAGVAYVLLFAGLGSMAVAGHMALAVIIGITIAILLPISLVILIASMFISSALGGGINFGLAHLAVAKAALLLLIVTLVSLIPFAGLLLTFPIWLFGLMIMFDLDIWEARFVIFINWMLNTIVKWCLLGLLLTAIMHGPDLPLPGPGGADQAEQGWTAFDVEIRGGHVQIDKKNPDRPVVGIIFRGADITDDDLENLQAFPELRHLDLTGTKVTDAGLEHLKKLPKLTSLSVGNTRVTMKAIKELQKAMPNLKLT
jgi:hypothetical protein